MAVFSLWSKVHTQLQLQACRFPVLFIIPLSHKNLKYMKMRLAAESSYCISRLRHRKRKHKAISCLVPEAFLPSLDISPEESTSSGASALGRS